MTQRQFGFGAADLGYDVGSLFRLQFWRLLTYPFVVPQPFGLVLAAFVLWLFGSGFEARWGSRDFFQFFAASTIGAGIIAVPLYLLFNALLPFTDVGMAYGPWTAIDAMLVAMAVLSPDATILAGFVLPIRAKTAVYIFLGFEVLRALMTGASTLSVTLGGMLMGYVLVTGLWRPDRLVSSLGQIAMRLRRRRRGLYIVPPRGQDQDNTLH
jgi:membrane associated rhomboid family serine protease